MFSPDPNHPSTWILLICLICASVTAFGPKKIRRPLTGMAEYVIMVPWILFSGIAADYTKYMHSLDQLKPTELLDHPIFNFHSSIPILGIAMVLISTLLWIGAKRNLENENPVRIFPHLIPGIFLLYHSFNAERYYHKVVESPGAYFIEVESPESGLDSNILLMTTLFSCGLLAFGFLRLKFPKQGT